MGILGIQTDVYMDGRIVELVSGQLAEGIHWQTCQIGRVWVLVVGYHAVEDLSAGSFGVPLAFASLEQNIRLRKLKRHTLTLCFL